MSCVFQTHIQKLSSAKRNRKKCLKQGGLSAEIKARVLGCQAQMNSFNYLFRILYEEWLFAHTENFSAALQNKDLSAVAGQSLGNQTMETLKRIRDKNSYNFFYDTVLEEKKITS